MARFPYFLVKQVTLGANGTGTMTHIVPNSEALEVHELRQKSTGLFGFTDIRTTDGVHMTNASPTIEIDSDFFADVQDENNGMKTLFEPLVIKGGITLYIDVEDLSGSSNEVTLVFSGVRIT